MNSRCIWGAGSQGAELAKQRVHEMAAEKKALAWNPGMDYGWIRWFMVDRTN